MIMKTVFAALEEQGIRYLHFKSNTNLRDSFEGRGDFDVLADPRELPAIERILLDHNGKRHNPVRFGQYPGVDNWLIMDPETGMIYHLHLHYQLATGKKLLKDYVLPWNDLLFDTARKDPEYGIYITDPSLELIMLSVRSVLKSRFPDWLKARMGMYHLYSSLSKERKDLQQKADWNQTESYLRLLFAERDVPVLLEILRKEKTDSADFRRLTGIVRRRMKINRRFGKLMSNFLSAYYRFRDLWSKVRSRKLGGCPLIKKTPHSAGLIIAFVGVDGAGKSTVTKEICSWIGKKIECKRFYMGVGDGKTTVLGDTLKKANRMAGDRGKNVEQGKKLRLTSNPIGYLRKLMKVVLICDVEKNNVKKIRMMHRYRLNGGISVLDRYPQIEKAAQNDGPKIPRYMELFGDTAFMRRCQRRENKYLSIVREIKPDLVFRLNVSAETSMARKPDQIDIEHFRKKSEELKQITFQNANIIDIDAEQPYAEELLQIKKILWKYI